jgi:four helix bundle protein
MQVRDYRGLAVWQRAMELVVECYSLAERLPRHQRYELAAQLRRAAVSVVANIAEGNGRFHRREYVHHLSIARGSLLELATYVEIACRLDYVSAGDLHVAHELIDHVGHMLSRLVTRLQS